VLGLTRTRALLSRYGTAAEKLIKYLELNGDTELENLKGYSQQEIAFLAIEENAVRLDDFLLRRTTLAFSGLLNQERVQELAKVAAAALGWSAEQMQSEITRAWDILQFKHGVEKTGGRVAI
jgi:glycerol-3-phosphate dehydrogenase